MTLGRYGTLLLPVMLWGLWAFLPRLAAARLGSTSAVFAVQSVATFVGALVVWRLGGGSLTLASAGNAPGIAWATLAGLCGAGGLYFFLRASATEGVAVATSVTALYPVVAVVLARLVGGEALAPRQWAGVLLAAVAGVLLVAR